MALNFTSHVEIEFTAGVWTQMDADLLDAQEGSYYTNASNLASGTVPTARQATTLQNLIGSTGISVR